jgi:hypothetical protein
VSAQLFVSEFEADASSAPHGAFARATVVPQPASLAVRGSPQLTAGAQLIAPISGTEAFIDTSKNAIALLVGSSLTEEPLPSGDTPTMIAFGYYNAPLLKFAFATKQNTVGIIDNQDDVRESPAVSGGNIAGLAYYGGNFNDPVYTQSPGTIGLWNLGFVTYQVAGTPRLTNVVAMEDGSFIAADPGNDAVAIFGIDPGGMQAFNEYPAPKDAKGKPAFVAANEPLQPIWVAEEGVPEGFISGKNTFRTQAPLTSMATISTDYSIKGGMMAATDTLGNIELFDQVGKRVLTYTPPDGRAADIISGPDQDLYYVCPSCAQSIHEFLY